MGRKSPPRALRRVRDLGELVRQANHVVAAAVFVFVASILLGAVLSKPLVSAAGWIRGHWGDAGATILGPLLLDGVKALLLCAVAFPFGRVTAARPWPAGVGLVLIVYGFWFSLELVVGEHQLLWGHWRPAVGRGALLAFTCWAVVTLVKRGRRAALEADAPQRGGAEPADTEADAGKTDTEADTGKTDTEADAGKAGVEPPKAAPAENSHKDSEEKQPNTEEDAAGSCKPAEAPGVSGGER